MLLLMVVVVCGLGIDNVAANIVCVHLVNQRTVGSAVNSTVESVVRRPGPNLRRAALTGSRDGDGRFRGLALCKCRPRRQKKATAPTHSPYAQCSKHIST